MLLRVPDVMSAPVVVRVRAQVESADWAEQRAAGPSNPVARGPRQLPEDGKAARAASAIVLDAISQNATFFTGALPKKIYPPLFMRHDATAGAATGQVEVALRNWAPAATQVRVDLGATLFLSDPREYEGGELVLEDHFGSHNIKLRAGDLILYPASQLARVMPVTRGVRLSVQLLIESMVREDEYRRLLYELDMSILALRSRHGDSAELARLTGCYHNLMRLWATT